MPGADQNTMVSPFFISFLDARIISYPAGASIFIFGQPLLRVFKMFLVHDN